MAMEHLITSPFVCRPSALAMRERLLVLAYHGVEDPTRFRSQLEWLRTVRTPVSVSDLADAAADVAQLPPNSFLVTFDDGRRSVLTNGLPILRELGIPAALFVIPGSVGSADPYWWSEVEELSLAGARATGINMRGPELVRYLKHVPNQQRLEVLDELRATSLEPAQPYPHLTVDELRLLDRSGVTIGNHSLTHPMLDKCSSEVIDWELTESRRMLEGWLDRPVRAVAYPNGNIDETVIAAARRSGHELGFLFDHRLAKRQMADPLRISRVRVDATASLDRFKGIASGLLPAIHHLRRRP